MGLSVTQAARELGVSAPTLRRGITRGRLNRAVLPDGTIDIREARREWVMNADPTKGQVGSGNRSGSRSVNDVASTFNAAKAARAAFDAKLSEIDYKKAIGELIPAVDMERAIFETARRVRDRLQSIPARLAPVVAGLAGDTDECFKAIEGEVNQALDELAGMRIDPPS